MSILKTSSFEKLNGWATSDLKLSLETFQRSAREILSTAHGFKRDTKFGGSKSDWIEACQAALVATEPKHFFESHFEAVAVEDPERPQGLFTGYYEPEALGSRVPTPEFQVPFYKRPSDLVAFNEAQEQQAGGFKYGRIVDGVAQPYLVRQEIEQGALKNRDLEIAYIHDWADAFFMHIQGSGRVRLPDGKSLRMAYALKTGHPYTGIGGVLVERGVLTKDTNSMQSIRAWLKANPAEACDLMWMNKSFVFFREVEITDEHLGALGAQQVNLTPLRSLAVDRSVWQFGTPIWLDTKLPPEAPVPNQTFQNLMVAQDTGSAVKGHVRGDVYWGWGSDAAQIAGHMKSQGSMHVLLPKAVARALTAK